MLKILDWKKVLYLQLCSIINILYIDSFILCEHYMGLIDFMRKAKAHLYLPESLKTLTQYFKITERTRQKGTNR